jgi:hypothetical protein
MKDKIEKTAIGLLGRPLNAEDGLSMDEIEAVEIKLKYKLPIGLKYFYNAVGNLELFMSSFEDFPEPYLLDNKIIFLEENQGVCYWGIDTKDIEKEDPLVYVCTDPEAEEPEWYPEEVTLAKFLEILLYYQCAQGGYEYGGAVYETGFESRAAYEKFIEKVVVGWEKTVDHNGLVIYQQEEKLIWHFTDEEGKPQDILFGSARTEKGINELKLSGFTEL